MYALINFYYFVLFKKMYETLLDCFFFLHYSNENLRSKVLNYDEMNVILLTNIIILNTIAN